MNKKFFLIITFLGFAISKLVSSSGLVPDSIKIKSLIDSAEVYRTTNTDTALFLSNRAQHLALSLHHNYLLADTYFTKACIFKYKQHNDSALWYYHKSIVLLDSLVQNSSSTDMAFLLSCALNDAAEIHTTFNNFDQAMEYNLKASEVNNKYGIENREINALITRGKIARLTNNFEKAKEYWSLGLELAKKTGDTDLTARLLNNLGGIYYYDEDWKTCLIYFSQAYQLQKTINNETELVPAANNMGLIYLMLNKYDSAICYLTEGEQLSEKHKLLRSQAIALHYLIETYVYANKPEKTRETFSKFADVVDELYSTENATKINELETKYQAEKKERKIESLQKDNEIKNEKVKAQRQLIWWATTAFLLIMAFIFVYYKLNQTRQLNIQNELRIKSLTNEQKMLRSQMNPHFIYNSLNSIQAFISSDDSYNAEKYLARFAKLMRGILENSRADFISLSKEIEVLDLYMELEQLRFENRFTYKIVVDHNIEPDFISIPPMLIQPFIENCIIHGFKGKTDGILHINFIENNGYINCHVQDNGIGRQAAAKLNEKKNKESLATKITQERLKTLSTQLNKNAFFVINDLKDPATGSALGTSIDIKIPYIEE